MERELIDSQVSSGYSTGQMTPSSSPSPMVSPEIGRVKRSKWGWIVVAVVVIALVIVGLWWHFSGKSTSSNTAALNSTGKTYTEEALKKAFPNPKRVLTPIHVITFLTHGSDKPVDDIKQEISWLEMGMVPANSIPDNVMILAKPGVKIDAKLVEFIQKYKKIAVNAKCSARNSADLHCTEISTPKIQKSKSGHEYVIYTLTSPYNEGSAGTVYFMQVGNLGFFVVAGEPFAAEKFEKHVDKLLHKLDN